MENKQKAGASPINGLLLMVKRSITDDGNVRPNHGIFLKNDALSVFAYLDLTATEISRSALAYILKESPEEGGWGLDRYSKPGQGVDEKWDSVYTIYHYRPDFPGRFMYGVLPYSLSRKEHGEVDWNNEFWKQQMDQEIVSLLMGEVKKRSSPL